MDYGSVKLYFDCNENRHSIIIKLNQHRVEGWDYNKLRHLGVEPEYITGIEIGPNTTVEIYSGVKFDCNRWTIKNDLHHKNKYIDFACGENCYNKWYGKLKSIKVWEVGHHKQRNNIPYCESNHDCPDDHLCLCPRGEARNEWCPLSKRRCLHRSNYLQSKPKNITDGDLVDTRCFIDKIEHVNRRYVRFNDIKSMAEMCYGEDIIEPEITHPNKRNPERASPTIQETNDPYLTVTDPKLSNVLYNYNTIEGFSVNSYNYMFILMLFIFVFIFIIYLINKKKFNFTSF